MAMEHRWDIVPVLCSRTRPGSRASRTSTESWCRCAIHEAAAYPRFVCGRKEVAARREHNRERTASLLETFRFLDIDPVVVSSSDPADILAEFLLWVDLRRTRRVIGA